MILSSVLPRPHLGMVIHSLTLFEISCTCDDKRGDVFCQGKRGIA
jgi:hypothetical protein